MPDHDDRQDAPINPLLRGLRVVAVPESVAAEFRRHRRRGERIRRIVAMLDGLGDQALADMEMRVRVVALAAGRGGGGKGA